ncbi:hypothetical protein GP486_007626, partial [Trichoglossum hirsutum]
MAKTFLTKKHMRKPGTGSLDLIPNAEEPPSGVRRSLRLQKKPPASHAAKSRPVRSSANKETCTKPERLQCKRTKEPKGKCPPRRKRRRCTHSHSLNLSEKPQINGKAGVGANEQKSVHPLERPREPLLSESDLRSLYREVMTRKQAQVEEGTIRTQRSRVSNGDYRYEHLQSFNIFIRTKPSDEIAAEVRKILSTEVDNKRSAELRDIANRYSDNCRKKTESHFGEDNYVELLSQVIEELGFKSVIRCNKTNWNKELKPADQLPLDCSSGDEANVQQQE